QAFSFGTGAGGNFAGTVNLTNNTFALSGNNTAALTHATLNVGTGNVTTVGDGTQAIAGLNINGGTMVFDATAPDQKVATSLVKAGTLDVSHTGTVVINAQSTYTVPPANTYNSVNLLMQDDANVGVKLVSANTVSGSGGALSLMDSNGLAVSAPRQTGIVQNGNSVAKGTYDYRLTTGPAADGLYVNYGLTQLDLQSGQTLTLAEDTGATGASADMSAKIIGSGNLAINAGAGMVSLSNTTNDYTGETSVTSGTLRSEADNALGQTSKLSLANTAGFDLNGKTQTVGSLAGAAGSTLDVHGGTLNVSNGGSSAGTLTGAGQLNVNGGTLDIQGANTSLTTSTAISRGATINLNNVAGLGSGAITDNGTLALNGATGTLANAIGGAGAVNLTNSADVTLLGSNTLSGRWNTAAGTRLTASAASNLGTAAINNAGTFNIDTATDWTLTNMLGGTGDFTKNGTGTLTIAQANAGATGTTTISDGELRLTDAGGVGSGTVNVNTTAHDTRTGLELGLASAGTFANTLAGAGTTTVSGAQVAIASNNAATYTGDWNVAGTGTLAVANTATSSTDNLGAGGVDIAAGGTVNANTAGAFSFDNALTGAGTLNASNSNQAFSFGTGAGGNFAGTVNLTNNTFALSGNNTAALTHATLNVGTGNVTTVGDGTQAIAGLNINGGTMAFSNLPTGTVKTGTLTLTSGNVELDPQTAGSAGNLLAQDEGVTRQLVSATSVNGSANNLSLKDLSGNILTSGTSNIVQGGNTVAVGTYSYNLATSATGSSAVDGLYAGYRLTLLALQSGQTTTLSGDTATPSGSDELHAKLTGAGNLAIDATGTITLSNTTNDYTGETSVTSGTLRSEADNALGQTS
ncbi:autotransporter-associated beta strand repeat-containing protein, partial [Burkholderia pseudomallei]|uniref:autotransporter-associated beta strand repeat-containing protein n=1 Tax=Burkholderia pseudomallei TaxID=28450 RepID=UPI0018ACFEF0